MFFRKKIIAMLMAGACFGYISEAQDLPSEVNVIPPSPNVAALNKYIEIPVSQYTGVPNVSVPIYNIQMQQLSLPISLNYHASGLKVEEYASWVGAGWSLSAGGTVNRTVRGLPDEFLPGLSTSSPGKKGYFFNNKLFRNDGSIDIQWLDKDDSEVPYIVTPEYPGSTPDSLARGYLDTQPDLYNFSYPGGSGKFVFSRSGEVMKFSKEDTKFIEHPFDSQPFPMMGVVPSATDYVWILEAPDGTRYKYSKSERTKTHGGCGVPGGASAYDSPINGHESAWLLEEVSLNGEWIRFEYVTEDILYSMRTSVTENFKVSGSGSPSNSTCTSTLETKTQRLSRIHTSNGIEVKFIVDDSIDRLDLPGSKSLQRVEIRHGNEDVAFYKLHHDYFGVDKKLKLTQVNKENEDGTIELPGQTFDYYGHGTFPALDSNNQDYWGFFNIATNGAFIIPPFKREEYHVNQASPVNRDPVLLATQSGTLQRITYPTGGSTTLAYELHDYFEVDHNQTYVYEATANGAPNAPDIDFSIPFTISQTSYATLTLNGTGGQILKQQGNDFLPVTLGTIVGNRNVIEAGVYKLQATSSDNATHSVRIEFEIIEPTTAIAGGLRVKTITTYDPESDKTIRKSYEYTQEGSTESSGKRFAPIILGGDLSTHTSGTIHYVSTSSPASSGGSSGSNEESGGEEEEGGGEEGGGEEEGGIEEEEEPVQITENGLVSGCTPGASLSSINVRGVSQLPSTVYHGSHIGYSRVREYYGYKEITANGEKYPYGVIDSEFINEVPGHNLGAPFVPTIDLGHKNGKLLKQTVYKFDENAVADSYLTAVSQTENVYAEEEYTGEKVFAMSFAQMNSYTCYVVPNTTDYVHNYYELKPKWHYLSSTIERQFFDGGQVETSSQYGYSEDEDKPYFMYDSKEWEDSQGQTYRQLYTRHPDFPALVVESQMAKGNEIVSGNKVTYLGKLPASISSLELGTEDVYRLVRRYNYASNLLSLTEEFPQANQLMTQALGLEKRYLWGYGGSVPVAEITGYLNNGDVLAISGINQAILDNPANENQLQTELAKLRKDGSGNDVFPGTLITTYTYKRGVGITSMTDPNGFTSNYFYDAFNRLIKVMDQDGNIIQTNKYHYKGQ